MKKYYIPLFFLFPLLTLIPYFLPTAIRVFQYSLYPFFQDVGNFFFNSQIKNLTVYYRYMFFFLALANTIISVIFIFHSKERDVRFFFSMFGLSMLIYLLNAIFDVIDLYGDYPWEFFNDLSDFIGNLPILILLIVRVVLDVRLIKKESRSIFFFGAVVASSGFVIVALIATRLAISQGVPREDFLLYLPFLIEIVAIMILLLVLYIIYMELSFRYYILALLTGYFFSFLGDTYQLFYGLFEDVTYRTIARMFTLLTFSYFFAILLWVRGKRIIVSSLTEIEKERSKYKGLYLELDDKISDLLILTQLLRHDLGNDIIVISNALELYDEKKTDDLLVIAKNRIGMMENRIQKLRSSSEIYESLKTQEISISFVNDVAKLFDKVSVKIKNRNLKIKGNQLINFILFNLIQNSFKHGGEKVSVNVSVEERGNFVVLKVADNGIGMTDHQKDHVLSHVLTIEYTDEMPKGVGLSLAKTTVEGLGGRFKIEDNEPQGTIVVLELQKFVPDISDESKE